MKIFRLLLLPFSWIYGSAVWLRNKAFDGHIFKSHRPDIKTITIGNIALGGTGKTPHIEYCLRLLRSKKVAVLSRGYGRQTRGTLRVRPGMSARECGDEPLQIARKFENTLVVVDEERVRGIAFICENYPNTELILLDDALQHRKIEAGLNLLLTTYESPFFADYYLPAGNLRDHKIRARDADAILVTKCPEKTEKARLAYLEKKLDNYCETVLFDRIIYRDIRPLHPGEKSKINDYKKVLLISGIAMPGPFVEAAGNKFEVMEHFNYPDHYAYTDRDAVRFRKFIGSFAPGEIAVLTTEKDAMRLHEIIPADANQSLPVFYWEIGIDAGNDQKRLDNLILNYAN